MSYKEARLGAEKARSKKAKLNQSMKAALIGANGSGKSSLLNLIYQQAEGMTFAPNCKMGYFTQMLTHLPKDQTLLEAVRETSSQSEALIRKLETEQAAILGKLSMARRQTDKADLVQQYDAVMRELNQLR